jgi:hypothetical protein
VSAVTKRPVAIAIVACLLAATPAYAQEAADAETALQLYKDGKQLRDAGNVAGGLEKLRAAYALVATPITALELARTLVSTGRLVEAREIALGVARIPLRKNESQKSADARAEAEALAAQLKPRLASITIKPRPAQPTPKVTVDGVVVPSEAALVPRVVDPGKHAVVVTGSGPEARAEIVVGEGESKDVAIDVPPGAKTSEPVASVPGGGGSGGSRSPLVYAGFGVAVVGVAVGSVTGVLTLSKASDLKGACASDGRCPPARQSDLDASSTTGTISTVAFVVAGVGVAVGVIGLALGKSTPASATVGVAPGGASVRF